MKTKQIVIGLLVVLLAAGGLVAFKEWQTKKAIQAEKDSHVKIISSVPMRGMTVGQGMYNGADMAFAEVGYKAGKFTIEFIPKDDGDADGKWQKDLEQKIAEDAVADLDVVVYMGTYNSGAAKVSIPITNAAGLAQVSAANTWPGLTQVGYLPGEPGIFYPTGKRTYFRTCPTDAMQGPAAALWMKELGAQNVYIVDDSDVYGKGVAGIVEKKANEIGLKVLARKSISGKVEELSKIAEVVKDIKKQKPDFIYYGGITPNGIIPFIKELRATGDKTKLMGPDGLLEEAYLLQAGKDAEGTYITSGGLPPSAMTGEGATFVAKYKAKYGVEPDNYGIYSYEAAKVVIAALERVAKKDRALIVDEIAKTQNYPGFFGIWKFDENGDTTQTSTAGNIVENGKFKFTGLIGK
jgi:branched-chain amino acid transport system substrate-binding protein